MFTGKKQESVVQLGGYWNNYRRHLAAMAEEHVSRIGQIEVQMRSVSVIEMDYLLDKPLRVGLAIKPDAPQVSF
jgi:hypothetical protein